MSLFSKPKPEPKPERKPNDYVFGKHYFAEFHECAGEAEPWSVYSRHPRRDRDGDLEIELLNFSTDTKEHAKALIDYLDAVYPEHEGVSQ